MWLNATHGRGSEGTNVLSTIAGCLLFWASTGPDISKIATEIRIALMLRLLHHYGVAALVRWWIKQSHQRCGWPGGKTLTRIRVVQPSVFEGGTLLRGIGGECRTPTVLGVQCFCIHQPATRVLCAVREGLNPLPPGAHPIRVLPGVKRRTYVTAPNQTDYSNEAHDRRRRRKAAARLRRRQNEGFRSFSAARRFPQRQA